MSKNHTIELISEIEKHTYGTPILLKKLSFISNDAGKNGTFWSRGKISMKQFKIVQIKNNGNYNGCRYNLTKSEDNKIVGEIEN